MKKTNNQLKYIFLSLVCWLSFIQSVEAQKGKIAADQTLSIAFWNVENLYDTINDPLIDDEEFLPFSEKKWNTEKYMQKLNHLADVIAQLGDKNAASLLPAVLGMAEIENSNVLKDLINQSKLKSANYQYIHFNGPDKRGIDVALLYNPAYFKPFHTQRYQLTIKDDTSFATREQLVVSGKLMGEPIHFIVAHWPSRRGGTESNPKRIAAAKLGRHIADSLFALNENANIIYMGDLNDDPKDESVSTVLNSKSEKSNITKNQFYNPMYNLHRDSTGTLCYRSKWNLFDQTLLSFNLFNTSSTLRFKQAAIFNAEMVREKEGKYKGEPYRSFAGSKYLGGYSDHFAVYVILTVKQAARKTKPKKIVEIQSK